MSYRVRVVICLSTVLALGIFIGKYLQDSALLLPEAHAAGSPVPGPNTLAFVTRNTRKGQWLS